MTIWILRFQFEIHEVTRGVTAMVVGSGALLDLFCISKTDATEKGGNPDERCVIAKPLLSSKASPAVQSSGKPEDPFSARAQRDERTSTKPFFVQRSR